MQLYFIRHGQSENNAHWGEENYLDKPDPELTEIGQAQAQEVARFLAEHPTPPPEGEWNPQNRLGFGLTHLYTSLMVRAVATAIPLAEATGLPPIAWPEIHETGGIFARDQGELRPGLPGKTRSYFAEHYPSLVLPAWLDERGWWNNRPFEQAPAYKARGQRVWDDLLARHADQPGCPEHRVAIVSHGGFFMSLLAAAIGLEIRRISPEVDRHTCWFLKNNCAITRLDVTDQVLVCYVNRTDFLPDHLIT